MTSHPMLRICCACAASGHAAAAPPRMRDELAPSHVLPSGRGSHPTTSLKESRVVHHSNFGHPTSATGQLHALPRRSIAVRFTSINKIPRRVLGYDRSLLRGTSPAASATMNGLASIKSKLLPRRGLSEPIGSSKRHSRPLRRAMLDYMNDASNPRNAYPALWAPFVVVGDGAAR